MILICQVHKSQILVSKRVNSIVTSQSLYLNSVMLHRNRLQYERITLLVKGSLKLEGIKTVLTINPFSLLYHNPDSVRIQTWTNGGKYSIVVSCTNTVSVYNGRGEELSHWFFSELIFQ